MKQRIHLSCGLKYHKPSLFKKLFLSAIILSTNKSEELMALLKGRSKLYFDSSGHLFV